MAKLIVFTLVPGATVADVRTYIEGVTRDAGLELVGAPVNAGETKDGMTIIRWEAREMGEV